MEELVEFLTADLELEWEEFEEVTTEYEPPSSLINLLKDAAS